MHGVSLPLTCGAVSWRNTSVQQTVNRLPYLSGPTLCALMRRHHVTIRLLAQRLVVYPGGADNCLAPTARYNALSSHRCEGALPWGRTCFATSSH